MKIHVSGFAIALLALIFGSAALNAEVKVLHVDPQQTDAGIDSVHGPHIALYDPAIPNAHKLFLFLSGTKGKAENSLKLDTSFTKWGYHAISLDYEDDVVAVTCAHSPDTACFDKYRAAIIEGTPGSDKVSVTPANSILNRIEKLLPYLAKQDPTGGWGEFVHHGKPVWSKIAIAGHSQGAGHAAYIAKRYKVDRVLMFSGPQDYFDDISQTAAWESQKSVTSPSRFFAFLNLHDPYIEEHQVASSAVLMDVARPETLTVQPDDVIQSKPQIIVNTEEKNPHGTTISPDFENVYQYLATTSIR